MRIRLVGGLLLCVAAYFAGGCSQSSDGGQAAAPSSKDAATTNPQSESNAVSAAPAISDTKAETVTPSTSEPAPASSSAGESVTLSGIVVDETGTPAPGAEVWAKFEIDTARLTEDEKEFEYYDFETERVRADALGSFQLTFERRPDRDALHAMGIKAFERNSEFVSSFAEIAGQLTDSASLDLDGFEIDWPDISAGRRFEGSWRLKAHARGFSQYDAQLSTDSTRIQIELSPGFVIGGRVVNDATQLGVPDVQLSAVQVNVGGLFDSVDWRVQAITDADGRFEIDSLSARTYGLRILATDQDVVRASDSTTPIAVSAQRPYAETTVYVTPAAVVEGYVRTADGTPISGAEVTGETEQTWNFDTDSLSFFDEIASELFESVTTDASGYYRLSPLRFQEEYTVAVKHESYAPIQRELTIADAASSPYSLDHVLTKGSVLTGRVFYEDGAPAAEAPIYINPSDRDGQLTFSLDPRATTAMTDRDGVYEFKHVAEGVYVVGTHRNIPFAATKTTSIEVSVDGVNEFLARDLVISREDDSDDERLAIGRVVGHDGAPVSDIKVTLSEGMAMGGADSEESAFLEGMDFSAFAMDVDSAVTDAEGRFRMEVDEIFEGPFSLAASGRAGRGVVKNVALNSEVVIRLEAPYEVSGVVIDGNGNGVPSARVNLKSGSNSMGDLFSGMFGLSDDEGVATDANGRFTISNPAPGAYTLEARHRVKGWGQLESVQVETGRSVENLRVELVPGGTVTGAVQDVAGEPIGNAGVVLRLEAASSFDNPFLDMMPFEMMTGDGGSTVTDDRGAFTLTNVQPGVHTLLARHADFANGKVDGLEVLEGQTLSGVVITLSNGGGVFGRYVVAGAPVQGAMVMLMNDGTMKQTSTDAEGRFEIVGLTAGTYAVQAMRMDTFAFDSEGDSEVTAMNELGMGQTTVNVVDGEMTEAVFDATSGVRVGGRVAGLSAEPGIESMAILMEVNDAGEALPMPTDIVGMMSLGNRSSPISDDGAFNMPNVPPGRYRLHVYSVDYSSVNFAAMMDMSAMSEMYGDPVHDELVTIGAEGLEVEVRVER